MDREKGFWLVRISNERDASRRLLDKYNYLSIGWVNQNQDAIIKSVSDEKIASNDYVDFENLWGEGCGYGRKRNRWSLWNFCSMRKGDRIVVPGPGEFCVCEVENNPMPATCLPDEVKADDIFKPTDNKKVDIGFIVEVKFVKNWCKRTYATGRLQSRMKSYNAVANLVDLKEDVDKVCEQDEPLQMYNEVITDNLVLDIRSRLYGTINDSYFERLIKWYFLKIGATSAEVLPKYKKNKNIGEDADVKCTFDNLNVRVFIQAKKHEGNTDQWAVSQIDNYVKNCVHVNDYNMDGDGYVVVKMVISLAEDFTEDVKKLAGEKGVKLISGNDFVRMLLDAGFSGVDNLSV